ncbi:MAG: glycosyltransferase family 2 protein [Candidatus Omnitrophica bacterium]|nr:glycosyltransferase family 2 protein [Candidatus Omnitrophota bacterium]
MKILVIIPAYNEAGNIERVVREVLALPYQVVVLVVNDGSSDNTAERALGAGARVVTLPFNLGIGGAVQTGYRYALDHDFDVAVQVDGDGQHDVSFLSALIEPFKAREADMVIGSRFLMPEGGFRSSFTRRIGISFLRVLIRALTNFPTSDPTAGFRACGRRLINVYAGYYPVDFPEPEAIVVACRLGARVKEVPVTMRARLSGKSSIGKLKSPYYMIKVTAAILLHMIKDRKVYGLWK